VRGARTNGFETLHAEIALAKLKVLWTPTSLATNARVTLYASADDLGHWPTRDWQRYAMTWRGPHWEATVPIDNVDVPLAYFVGATETAADGPLRPASTNWSSLRICHPRAVGLEEPTRIFWPFLDGFEDGAEAWRLLKRSPGATLTTVDRPKNGHAALLVPLAAAKPSVTVATVRVRGWQLQQQNATGLRVWLRTAQGEARVRFAVRAHAFTPQQVVAERPEDVPIHAAWEKVDLLFDEFPGLLLGEVDLFTLEFIGQGPMEFLIDDLQLLGRWRLEPE
jgi:hypothetical protein